jgi:hypothetical protein
MSDPDYLFNGFGNVLPPPLALPPLCDCHCELLDIEPTGIKCPACVNGS